MADLIIGIDLGTTTTEAAVYRDGQVVMIPNPEGKIVTPSVVGVDEKGTQIVGEQAQGQYLIAPNRTAIEFKRKMGTEETIKLGQISYTPVQLSAQLLSYVRQYASEYLGEEVKHAVISVPAYFDDLQRRDVVLAGTMAGFQVDRLINEPTAAALSYGVEHLEEDSYVLVYDLGGGTFDVTLLELFEGVLEVKASAGDNQLGGKDFDEALIQMLTKRFKDKTGVSLEGDVYAAARLKEQAEQCKIALSTQEEAAVRIPMLAKKDGIPLELDEVVTRAEFEQVIELLMARTHAPVRTVLQDAEVEQTELETILMVGGSTRIPMVAREIQTMLGKTPSGEMDPDFSVARGAAIQAAIIAGVMEPDKKLVMTDVCAYTLGVECFDGYRRDRMSVIIPRNTTIPVTRTENYWTAHDFQTEADVSVYQGEASFTGQNHFLGSFTLSGIPPAPAQKEKLLIQFTYNLNGMLDVKATIESTGKEAEISINMMETQETQPAEDLSKWKEADGAEEYRSTIRRGEKFCEKMKKVPDAEDDVQEAEELLEDLKRAILDGDLEEADEIEEDLLDLIEEVFD